MMPEQALNDPEKILYDFGLLVEQAINVSHFGAPLQSPLPPPAILS
jgi:hypothetical protein